MINSLSEIKEVEFNEELSVVVVRTSTTTPFESNNKRELKLVDAQWEPYLVKCLKKFRLYHLKN